METQMTSVADDRAEVVHATLDVAGAAVTTLSEAAGRLGMAFRGVDVTAANQDLAAFASSLSSLVEATNMVASILSVDLSRVGRGAPEPHNIVCQLAGCADDLINAHLNGDWMALADVIEYDVSASLNRWPALLDALREQTPHLSQPPA
jgi:hypothetical protein